MASSASGGADGGGRSSPPAAAAPRAVVDNLMDLRERAEMLRNMLQGSPTPPGTPADAAPAGTSELIDGIMSSLSSAMSALDTADAGGGHGQGRRRRRAGSVTGSGPQRRSSTARRRSHSPFVRTVTTSTLNDGNSWRKYGQKHIQDSPNNPRSYYRCTHKPDQGCRATRQVQASDDNPSEFVISYYGQHTCRDPSTIPLVIEAAAPPDDCASLISFGSTMGASTTTLAAPPQRPQAFDDPTMFISRLVGYSSSLPAQDYRCGSEEVHSSSSPPAGELAAAVGSAAGMTTSSATVVGSAPAEYWPGGTGGDMACGHGAGSFPSSPSSLGFMTGSFGSFGNAGDDDMFGFDP
ncbi:putative WRKY transcription factor 38 [Panicum miliaceum]|uniref:WRKY transcription factor 38 n=1 Tax=Panicum miliaceum TaxID=4540 RepID=A0A3L6TDB7_PANMI|nr:putative WRKY transcription factor 38 [Panicum miliaceum]